MLAAWRPLLWDGKPERWKSMAALYHREVSSHQSERHLLVLGEPRRPSCQCCYPHTKPQEENSLFWTSAATQKSKNVSGPVCFMSKQINQACTLAVLTSGSDKTDEPQALKEKFNILGNVHLFSCSPSESRSLFPEMSNFCFKTAF